MSALVAASQKGLRDKTSRQQLLAMERGGKGEAVGHQYVNKLPHSVNQALKVGQRKRWSCVIN